jgi:hypothetical protein
MIDTYKENLISSFEEYFNINLLEFQRDMVRLDHSASFFKTTNYVGKTYGLCAVALYNAVFNKQRVIMCGLDYNAINHMYDVINKIIYDNKRENIINKSMKAPFYQIEFIGSGRIRFFSANSLGLHGQEADIVCADNYDLYDSKFVSSSITPLLYTHKNTKIVGTGINFGNNIFSGFYVRVI